jgi:peptide/nickel transport system substrate-binding protein
MKSSNWNWLTILAALGLMVAACAPVSQPASPPEATEAGGINDDTIVEDGTADGSTIVVGLQAEPVTLDAQQMTDYNSTRAGRNIFDALLHFKDESTEVEPALAESWDISTDGKVYTFHLRQGVKFHDGTDFNADAVIFSFERQIDPNHPYYDTGEFAYADFTLGMVEKIEKVDDYTVSISLKEPFAPFLANMAMHSATIVSPTAVEKYGRDFSKNPVGTGAFKFVSWSPGIEIVLEKNPDYWDGSPTIDKVIYRPILDDQARMNELEAGGVDFIVNIPPDDLARLKADTRFTTVEQAGMHTWYVVFNCQKAPFDDVKVRQALNYAVDRQAIIEGILQNTGTLADSPLPPVLWSYTSDVQSYELNQEKARQLLTEAGYPDGLSINFWVPSSGSGMQQPVAMGQAIQADLKKVGVDAKIETFEWGTYLDKTIVEDAQTLPEMFQMSWIGDNGDPDNFLYILLSGDQYPPNGFNLGHCKDDAVDEILREARTTLDQAKRTELYVQAQKMLVEDAFWVPIDHETQIVVMKANITNFKLHPTGDFRFKDVLVEP